MSTNPPTTMSFAGLGDYEPWAGAAQGFVNQEGFYYARVNKATPGLASDNVKAHVEVACELTEEGPNKGVQILGWPFYSGTDRKGKSLARQFANVLSSVDTQLVEWVKKNGQANASQNIDELCKLVVGHQVRIEIRFDTYKGKLTSRIENFITEEAYQKMKDANQLRGRTADQVTVAQIEKERREAGGAGGEGSPTAPGNLNLGGPGGAPSLPAPALNGAPALPAVPKI